MERFGAIMKGEITQEMFALVPEIDFSFGIRYFLGNMENYTRALLSILKSIKSKLPLLQSMVLSEEYEGLRTIIQTLRKMLSNVGATELAESTYELETSLLNNDTRMVKELLSRYIEEIVVFSDHLEELLSKTEVKAKPLEENGQTSFLNYDFSKTKESIKRTSDLLGRKII